jgi:hypothetical protein
MLRKSMSVNASLSVLCMALLMTCLPLRISGQESAKDARADAMGQGIQKVSGCLQKGIEPGGFVLSGDDGKVWELVDGSGKLADHVGQKITVTGARVHESKMQENKMQKNEKTEAAGKDYSDLKVDKIEMVSASCR